MRKRCSKRKMEMMKTIRSKALVLFSEMVSLVSAAKKHLNLPPSLLPDTYTASTLLPKIAATAITRLVITRPKVQEMRGDEASWGKTNEQTASGKGEALDG